MSFFKKKPKTFRADNFLIGTMGDDKSEVIIAFHSDNGKTIRFTVPTECLAEMLEDLSTVAISLIPTGEGMEVMYR